MENNLCPKRLGDYAVFTFQNEEDFFKQAESITASLFSQMKNALEKTNTQLDDSLELIFKFDILDYSTAGWKCTVIPKPDRRCD